MNNILTWIFITFISLIPIIFWGYLFSYLDNSELNKKRFFVWILAWSISVIPVLFLDDFISKTNFLFLNIFSWVAFIDSFWSVFKIFISFLSLLFLLSIIPFISFYLFPGFLEKIKTFFKKYFVFGVYLFFVSVLILILNFIFSSFWIFDFWVDFWLSFWEVMFNSFKLVVFYYLVIAILEELSKFFCFDYSKDLQIQRPQDWVLYAVFIALGFSFVENILYFNSLYEKFSFGKELVVTFFSRNIFSVFLHIICSSIFAYYFSLMFIKYKQKINLEFIKILFVWFILSIILHSLFNIFLTFWLMFFVFLYLIWWYFYLTYIFYKEE